jgi:hypothetical protein
MDVKLNSKIHLQQTSYGVFEPFRATLAFKICKKCYYEQKNLLQKFVFGIKNADIGADIENNAKHFT